MKKIIILALMSVALIPLFAQAQALGKAQDIKTIREDRKQLRTDIKKKLWDERIALARARIGVIRTHITRLEDVANRLLQVAAQRESEGVTVTDARTKIASSTANLADAKTQLESIIANFPTEQTASSTPRATVSAIAKSLNKVVTLIKSAHQDLVDAWKLLKPVKAQETATSTASST